MAVVWATRAALAGDLEELIRIDREVLCRKLNEETRLMATRMGRKLAEMGADITENPLVIGWRDAIKDGRAPGTYPVSLAVQFVAMGLSTQEKLDAGTVSYTHLSHEYATRYPEQIEAFLRMYLRVIAFMRETPVEALVPDYIRFYEEWTGRKLSSEIAAKDLANHAVFNFEEQLALFDDAQGKSKLQTWLTDIAAFYESIGMVRKEDRQRLQRMNAVTDDYLKRCV